MRKHIILLFAFSLFSLFAYNQNVFIPETNLGIKIGVNVSRVAFDPIVEQNLNFGFVGGIVFKHISQKNLGIQMEINYLQAGWNEKLDSTNIYSRRLNYLQVPFMTHVNIGNGNSRFVLNLGPYLSFLVSDKEQIDLIEEEEEKLYYRTQIKNIPEFGLCFGIGFAQHTSIGLFQLEGRFNQSLSNIFKSDFETLFTSSKSQSLELTLSYFFRL